MKFLKIVLIFIFLTVAALGGFAYYNYHSAKMVAEKMFEAKQQELRQRTTDAPKKRKPLTPEELKAAEQKDDERKRRLPKPPLPSGIDPELQKAMDEEAIRQSEELLKAQEEKR